MVVFRCTILSVFVFQICVSYANYNKYNPFKPRASSDLQIAQLSRLMKDLKKDFNEIRKEMKVKFENIKTDMNCEIKDLEESLLKKYKLKELDRIKDRTGRRNRIDEKRDKTDDRWGRIDGGRDKTDDRWDKTDGGRDRTNNRWDRTDDGRDRGDDSRDRYGVRKDKTTNRFKFSSRLPTNMQSQSFKKRLQKNFKSLREQGDEIKKELRSQKAEMYAIRNSVYDAREDIMKKETAVLSSVKHSNDSLNCHIIDLRMHLFKINTNLGIIKRDQERIKDLIVISSQPDPDPDLMVTSTGEPLIGDPHNEKYLPGCTANPLETEETLQTFGSNYKNKSHFVPERISATQPPGKNYRKQLTPNITPQKFHDYETITPPTTSDCVDQKKMYLEYPPMPKDCLDAYNLGFMESGVYRIQPPGLRAREVFCDHRTAGGGWTVVTTRKKALKQTMFNRTWMEYEDGFGEPTREYWLGLKALHALTKKRPHQLRVELEDWEGNSAWAFYNFFSVDGPEEKYRLRVSEYSGTAGDSMRHSHLQMFSTIDKDNDQEDWGSCPRGRGGGGWWWGRCACTQPTGEFKKGYYKGPEKGITWWHWKDSNYSLKTIVLMIKAIH